MMLPSPIILTWSVLGKPVFVYISVSNNAVSLVIIHEEERVELRYQKIEKVALVIVITTRKLRPYFQSHPIICRTDLPIRQILRKLDLAGRMIGWVVELSKFDIAFERRGHMKAWVLVDFINELIPNSHEGKTTGANREWTLSVDRVLQQKRKQSRGHPKGHSNNQTEYDDLLAGIRLTKELGVKVLAIKSDSQLVNGECQAKDLQLTRYLGAIKAQVETLEGFTLLHVPQEQNERADLLAKLASTQKGGLNRTDKILEDPQEARRIEREVTKYVLIAGQFYRQGFSFPLLRCWGKLKRSELLKRFMRERVEAILVEGP
ncbi:hypothetical protein CR513_33078, partial [Mucuna pruriens]